MEKNLKIVFIFYDERVYYIPGSTVRGEVVVTVEKPANYKSVDIGILGQAYVCYSSGSGDSRQSHTNSVTYIKESSIVWKKEDSPSGELAVGDHTFPFEYQLPENIPSSFESVIGHMKYEIHAEFSLSKGSLKANTPIKVSDNTDHLSICMEPKAVDMSNRVNCLCFDFGTVNVTCNLPRTGFSPGDSIPIDLHIENQTTKAVRVRASLCKTSIFTNSGGGKLAYDIHEHVLMTPKFQAGVMTSFNGSLTIPMEVQTTYRGCSCISVEYSVVLKAVAALGSSVDMKIPIVIANKLSARSFLQYT